MWYLAPTLILPALPQGPSLVDELTAPVALEVDGRRIDSSRDIGHSGPSLHDLDGDGVAELLVGNFAGRIDVYERDAASTSPAWRKRGRLKAAGENFAVPNW